MKLADLDRMPGYSLGVGPIAHCLQWLDTLLKSPAVAWEPGQRDAAAQALADAREVMLTHVLDVVATISHAGQETLLRRDDPPQLTDGHDAPGKGLGAIRGASGTVAAWPPLSAGSGCACEPLPGASWPDVPRPAYRRAPVRARGQRGQAGEHGPRGRGRAMSNARFILRGAGPLAVNEPCDAHTAFELHLRGARTTAYALRALFAVLTDSQRERALELLGWESAEVVAQAPHPRGTPFISGEYVAPTPGNPASCA